MSLVRCDPLRLLSARLPRVLSGMKTFSIKSLFVAVAIAALIVAGSIRLVDGVQQYLFQARISAEWNEAPVVSRLVTMNETNDIVLEIEDGDLTLQSDRHEDRLIRRSGRNVVSFDLQCDLGEFHLIVYDDKLLELASSNINIEGPAYDVLKDAIVLDSDAHFSSENLWKLRAEMTHGWCNRRFEHFENSSKRGVIIGRIADAPDSVMYLFDSSGEYAIAVLPRSTDARHWEAIAGRLMLKPRRPADYKP